MSEFNTFEPLFQKSYKMILKYFKYNLIDVLDEHPWMGWVFWVKPLLYILTFSIHAGGVLDITAKYGFDLIKLSSTLSVALMLCQAVFLYLQVLINKKLIKNLILNIGKEWRRDEDLKPEMIEYKRKTVDHPHNWIEKFFKALFVFIKLYLWLPFLFVAFKHFILKMDVEFTMTIHTKVPFKYDDNFFIFLILHTADFFVLQNLGALVTSNLLLVTVSINHLRILFVLLQDDLKSIADSTDELENTKRRLKEIIPRHVTLLRLMKELSEAYGALFLIHLIFFSGIVCFFGFAARIHRSFESMENLLANGFLLIGIFSCCSYGQDLTDASLDIADAAYDCPWNNMPREIQTSILLIMMRSQEVYYIESTSYAEISLQSFTKILNVTWSFLSLIDKVYEG